MQENLNPVVEANLVYSGAVLDCAVLLANGWTETDEDGVFELEIKNKNLPPFHPCENNEEENSEEFQDFLDTIFNFTAKCRFARPGNFLYYKSTAKGGKKRDLRRLLSFECGDLDFVFDNKDAPYTPERNDDDAIQARDALGKMVKALAKAKVKDSLDLDELLSISQDRVEYKGRAELSRHDIPYGCLYNCILHFSEPGSDFQDGDPSEYRMASMRSALVPIVRALAGLGGDEARANVMAIEDAGLFCQLVDLADTAGFHAGAQIMSAALLLKCWDSLDSVFDPPDFAILANALLNCDCHVMAALCYAKTFPDVSKAYRDEDTPYIRISRAVDQFLKTRPGKEELPQLRLMQKFLDKVDKRLASTAPFTAQRLIMAGVIATIEERSIAPVADKAFDALADLSERLRPKDEESASFVAPLAITAQLLWDAWLALDDDALDQAVEAFPMPAGGYGTDFSTRMPHTFISGIGHNDVWRALAAAKPSFNAANYAFGTLPEARVFSQGMFLLNRNDQTSLAFAYASRVKMECKAIRRNKPVFDCAVTLLAVEQIEGAKPSRNGKWPDRIPANACCSNKAFFPWPVPSKRENKTNVKAAKVWQWYPWEESVAADLRILLSHPALQIYATCPAFVEFRNEIWRGASCDFFLFAVAHDMRVVDDPDATPALRNADKRHRDILRSSFSALGRVVSIETPETSPALSELAGAPDSASRLLRVTLDIGIDGLSIPVYVNSSQVSQEKGLLKPEAMVAVFAFFLADLRKVNQTKEDFTASFGAGLPALPEPEAFDPDDEPDNNGIHLITCNLDDIPRDEPTANCIESLAEGDSLELKKLRRHGPDLPREGEDAIAAFSGEIRLGALPKPHDAILMNLMDAGKNLAARVVRISINRGVVKIECAIYLVE